MTLKAKYLVEGGDKEIFRAKYIATEEGLNKLNSIAAVDQETEGILHQLDVISWNEQKQKNWLLARRELKEFELIGKDDPITPFSIIILMRDKDTRDAMRAHLMSHAIYPAILWKIPSETSFKRSNNFGERMLSIHCDARYTEQDIQHMCEIINQYDTNH